ncbi:2-octaprenyl-6-methoxyphenyl hydroxylase [Pseudoalteromonas aurantia]|uniref:2-octaprenyl-6-methoxyphenol hydroxylase n=1 Tax=Pseudoalteromonas aurantia 208 TaxID=1314867 RepID=A0ABR9E7B9_9GAMM|nr:2-octaprenyl-6-methoxyphenyl hydroxylase [Pseudoalteromonas aurantia]MBE0366895.1 2-octaprenyl-6-methoxyphenol hydroxylase [Pseudoalteromonas aurantia 208]
MQQFDVLIVGGGMAGATAALAIKKQCPTYHIGVIEAFEPQGQAHPSFDDRSIALAEQSVSYLKQFGLFNPQWSFAQAIHQVHVSDRGHFGKTDIDHQHYNCDALGYVVEVNPYGNELHRQLQSADIGMFCPANVAQLEQRIDHVSVTLTTGDLLSSKLLVLADGAKSPTRDKLQLGFTSKAYEQGALIANVEVAGGHDGQAFERFTEHGPMALLPMSKDRYSLVWCMHRDQLHEYQTMTGTQFIEALQSAFGFRAGIFTQVGVRAQYPLVLGKVDRVVHHRAVVIGNAAHAIHPIAGQGFNLGVRDIQSLVLLIEKYPREALGEFAFTHEFEQSRLADIDHVMTLTDGLVRLFSNRSRLVALGRNCGLLAMALSTRLKSPLAKQLMGHVRKGNK